MSDDLRLYRSNTFESISQSHSDNFVVMRVDVHSSRVLQLHSLFQERDTVLYLCSSEVLEWGSRMSFIFFMMREWVKRLTYPVTAWPQVWYHMHTHLHEHSWENRFSPPHCRSLLLIPKAKTVSSSCTQKTVQAPCNSVCRTHDCFWYYWKKVRIDVSRTFETVQNLQF